jgi:lipopolysaccharide biosynthesis glycosyltransferase
MSDKKTISIVVASDNHYAILIVALLKSIDLNHKTDEHISFNIIDDGIAKSFRKKLETIVDPARITINWFDSKSIIPDNISIPVDSSSFPLTAYLRVFSPYVVGQDLDKLIYLDVDIIVQDDISKLWNIQLGDYTVAAAQDVGKTVDCAWGGIANYKELGLAADTKYFNSGVLIVNPKKWRSENISVKVITALSTYSQYVQLADQYGLNVVLANKWLQLDDKWNWFAFKENDNPHLVHFLDIKPIFKSYNSQEVYKEQFYQYLSLTPWKNFKPISGYQRQIRKIVNKIKKAFMKL